MTLEEANYKLVNGCIDAAIHYPQNQAGGIGYIDYETEINEDEGVIFVNIIREASYGCDYNTPYFLDEKLKAIETLFDCKVKFV